jgi:hypothetical protein
MVANRLLSRKELATDLTKFLKRYAAAFPESADPHALLARLHLNTDNTADALRELRKAKKKGAVEPWVQAKIDELSGAQRGDGL